MTGQELQNASNERGMRSVGVSVDRLRNQLDQVQIRTIAICTIAVEMEVYKPLVSLKSLFRTPY